MRAVLQCRSIVAALALAISACGGHASVPGQGDNDAGPDAGLTGASCNFDTDCAPPDYICDTVTNTCVEGCGLNPTCPPGKTCNQATGRCILSVPDGGHPDGGADGGADAGPGTPSDTLCHACTVNSDCHAGGICVSNATHTGTFCTQDCTTASCPDGFRCTLDRTGTQHQCYPNTGDCSGLNGNPPDGGVGGNDGGPTNDPNVPSDNPNGCGFCGQCAVNNDCVTGSVCVNGTCAVGPCTSWFDCALHGGVLSSCTDVGLTDKYCLPLLGQCIPLPPPLTPLGGDTGCVPTGTNPSCTTPNIPGPALGGNVSVTGAFASKPVLASEDSIAVDSQGRMAIGFIGVDSSGNSYMGVAQSTDGGAHWTDKGKMAATTSVQSDPVLVMSKWTDGNGAHERMHYVWVGYTIVQQNGQYIPTDMFMESSYSDDGGGTWAPAIKATTTGDNNNNTLLLDKPWITVSNDASQTLMLNFSIGDNTQQHMYAVFSTDHGLTWGSRAQLENGDNNHGHNLGMPWYDPSDTTGATIYDVFVTYTQTSAGTSNSISLVKSTDRGATWSAPISVSDTGDQVLFEAPSITGDTHHHLYVGYTAAQTGNDPSYWDPIVATVDISGSAPTVVNRKRVSDDSPNCFQHFHVMTAVDPVSGTVYAGWLDNRQGGQGGTWYSISADGGATWSANKLASDSPYTFNPDHANAQLNFLGDYFGFIFDGSKLRLAWSDPRDGTSSQVFYAGGTP